MAWIRRYKLSSTPLFHHLSHLIWHWVSSTSECDSPHHTIPALIQDYHCSPTNYNISQIIQLPTILFPTSDPFLLPEPSFQIYYPMPFLLKIHPRFHIAFKSDTPSTKVLSYSSPFYCPAIPCHTEGLPFPLRRSMLSV